MPTLRRHFRRHFPRAAEPSLVMRRDLIIVIYARRAAAKLPIFHAGDFLPKAQLDQLHDRLGHVFEIARNGDNGAHSAKYTGELRRSQE